MEGHPFKMPFAPVTNYLTIAFLIMVLVGMWFNDETRISLIAGLVFLAISYNRFLRIWDQQESTSRPRKRRNSLYG